MYTINRHVSLLCFVFLWFYDDSLVANATVTSEGMDDIEQYQTKTKYNKTRIVYICIGVLLHINYILQIILKLNQNKLIF